MIDQNHQEKIKAKSKTAACCLFASTVLLIIALFLNSQASVTSAEAISQITPLPEPSITFADVMQAAATAGFTGSNVSSNRFVPAPRCVESELGIPLVVYSQWQLPENQRAPNSTGMIYMHDLFLRTQCPDDIENTFGVNP